MSNGHDQNPLRIQAVDHAIREPAQTAAPGVDRQRVPALRMALNQPDGAKKLHQKRITQTGSLLGVHKNRLVQLRLSCGQEPNAHAV